MRRLLVTVRVPVEDKDQPDEGEFVTIEDKNQENYREMQGYLHHWGQQFHIATDEKNQAVGVGNYTVAIVEEVDTGQMHVILPEELKILGYTTYK